MSRPSRRAFFVGLLPALLLGAAAAAPGRSAPEGAAAAARGRALAQRFQCNRCHDGAGLTPAPRKKHCVHCHQAIEAGTFPAPAKTLAKWREDIVHLLDVPSLDGVKGRLRPGWVEAFLLAPRDLRPALGATMPRLPIEPDQARDLAAWLAGPQPKAGRAPSGDPARGQQLLEEKRCGFCHRMTGHKLDRARPPAGVDPAALARGVKLAPDLALTRERMVPSAVVPWLRDPARLKPGTAMPDLGLTAAEARDIAAFLVEGELGDDLAKPPPERLPVLDRPVTFDEVNAKVFRKTCWHCHAEPAFAFGDGGAGNTGGFGFRPRGLDLSSYTAVLSGSRDDQGRRRSIFKDVPEATPAVGGLPRLIAHLVARQREEAGQAVPGVRGMPLGLPALSPEEVQLVESWIAQGRPR